MTPAEFHRWSAGAGVETQESIGTWAVESFGPGPLTPRHCIRLLEEVVELCQAAGATTDEIDAVFYRSASDAPPDPAKMPEELADCAIVLDTLAHRAGVDLRDRVDRKMAINRSRKWRVLGDGTGYHVKDSQEIPENKGDSS